MAKTSIIDRLKLYNERFCHNLSHGDENCHEIFEFVNRHSQLILSAPHATRSFVCKKERIADLYTGALVQYWGEEKQVSTLIRTKFTPYKALISDYVVEHNLAEHYFLDIHGFDQDIGYDICLGIGECEEKDYPFIQDIVKIATQYKFKTIIGHPQYRGTKGFCGRYLRKYAKPNVIQMEIHKHLRDFYQNPDIVKNATLPFLCDIIAVYQR